MNDHSQKMIPFTITDRAVEQIAKIISNESKPDQDTPVFRLAVLEWGMFWFSISILH